MDVTHFANLVMRQTEASQPIGTSSAGTGQECEVNNDYDGRMGLRISAIFVILVGSMSGAIFPVFARRRTKNRVLELAFFFAKYFGSGVIIATAFIHLLAPAVEALNNPCLNETILGYPWPMAIALIMIFVLFFVELMTVRYAGFGHAHTHDEEGHVDTSKIHEHKHPHDHEGNGSGESTKDTSNYGDSSAKVAGDTAFVPGSGSHIRGEDHLGHGREHVTHEPKTSNSTDLQRADTESYASQLTAIFILEFGVIFHSIFIGLTLAVSGDEFVTLYIVLVFHQTFEGLGLGTRLASVPWPRSKRWTPYLLAIGYGISTPIAIAVGLGVRQSFSPGSATFLIVNGVFDSISAGILIYTGLVELMAHEFMFSPSMRKAPLNTVFTAFAAMVLGAGLMSLLGKWA